MASEEQRLPATEGDVSVVAARPVEVPAPTSPAVAAVAEGAAPIEDTAGAEAAPDTGTAAAEVAPDTAAAASATAQVTPTATAKRLVLRLGRARGSPLPTAPSLAQRGLSRRRCLNL